MLDVWKKVDTLQWDDIGFGHQCCIDQTWQRMGGISFVAVFAPLFGKTAAAVLVLSASLFGLIEPAARWKGYVCDVALGWSALGNGGHLFRAAHLFLLHGPAWGLAWATKIVTDPFHNIAIYLKSPLALIQRERLDSMGTERRDSQTRCRGQWREWLECFRLTCHACTGEV